MTHSTTSRTRKAGRFLRMLEDYLGPEVFRRGIHRYLADHSYSNTTGTDLWDALETESGKPVRDDCVRLD